MTRTSIQFDEVIGECRDLFEKKQSDYGASFRVLRTISVVDQILIKVKNLRNYQLTGISKVGDSEKDNFTAIVNYSVIGLIQLEKGFAEDIEGTKAEIMSMYDQYTAEAKSLMEKKNHDYGEAWRDMELESITDLIFQKILRMKSIHRNNGLTQASEGLDANFFDMLNYAVFCLMKVSENQESSKPKFV